MAEILLRKEGIAAAKNVYLKAALDRKHRFTLVAGNKGMHVFSKAAYERIIAYKKIAAANKDFVIKTLQGSDRNSVSGYCAFWCENCIPGDFKIKSIVNRSHAKQ